MWGSRAKQYQTPLQSHKGEVLASPSCTPRRGVAIGSADSRYQVGRMSETDGGVADRLRRCPIESPAGVFNGRVSYDGHSRPRDGSRPYSPNSGNSHALFEAGGRQDVPCTWNRACRRQRRQLSVLEGSKASPGSIRGWRATSQYTATAHQVY